VHGNLEVSSSSSIGGMGPCGKRTCYGWSRRQPVPELTGPYYSTPRVVAFVGSFSHNIMAREGWFQYEDHISKYGMALLSIKRAYDFDKRLRDAASVFTVK